MNNNNNISSSSTPWHMWRKMRTLCDESQKLFLALEVTNDLPSEEEIERWFSEPVKCVIVPTSLFISNKSGFPVLSKAHQRVLHRFLQLDVDLIIEGANRHADKGGIDKYVEYLNFLHKQHLANLACDQVAKFVKGYEDCLQNPLQPLMDNLESQVYEIFEKDPIKYHQYQRAIACALEDRVPDAHKSTEGNEQYVFAYKPNYSS